MEAVEEEGGRSGVGQLIGSLETLRDVAGVGGGVGGPVILEDAIKFLMFILS